MKNQRSLNSKSKILIQQTNQIPNSKKYDLEGRLYSFAKRVNENVNGLPKAISNIEDGNQQIKLSDSAGANYNESLGKKNFLNFSQPSTCRSLLPC